MNTEPLRERADPIETRRPQPGLRARPTPQTVHQGDVIWFPYTASQWMPGRVISTSRRGLNVEIIGGKVARAVHVNWSDARWQLRRHPL